MSKAFIDDIPATGKAGILAEDEARKKFVRRYERLVRDAMRQININAAAYTNKRVRSKSDVTAMLRKVLKNSLFIPAHPRRFHAGGYVVEETKYFVLHRPGIEPKGCRFDNIIREFVQPGRQAASHFIISQTGARVQMVDLNDIAFHCGPSHPAHNSNSVGVELEGAIGQPMSQAMLDSLANLIAIIAAISGMPINKDTVLNHSTILPSQKRDAWIPRKIGGVIQDSKLQRILDAANAILPRIAESADFYKSSFDPRKDATSKLAEIMALAATPGTSYVEMAHLQAAAASQAAFGRTTSFGMLDRTTIGTNAALHAAALSGQMGSMLAAFIRTDNVNVQATPQENNVGVLLDQSTGLVNDGNPL